MNISGGNQSKNLDTVMKTLQVNVKKQIKFRLYHKHFYNLLILKKNIATQDVP